MNFRKVNFRSPAALMVLGGVATLGLFLVVVSVLARTGGAKAISDNAAVIGALVALGGVLTAQMVSVALDDRRSQEARQMEAQRAQETALQKYFEDVGKLLIEQPLRRASPGDNLSTVVRAQTLAVLEGLDPGRKRILLQFLYESGLIHRGKPVVSLSAANLSNAHLSKAHLSEATLRGSDLSNADLRNANLSRADLSRAILRNANLIHADLRGGVDLSLAYLIYADLSRAILQRAILERANLSGADLSRTNLGLANLFWAILSGAHLSNADLRKANLSRAHLNEADLSGATLIYADLSDAHLNGADLSDADLSGAREWTEDQLSEARTLKGATMPDGQILQGDDNPDGPTFEDWVKNKKAQGKDVMNE